MRIRPIVEADHGAWRELWAQYCATAGTTLPAHVTETTWRRLVTAEAPVFGLLAEDGEGRPQGFCHYVLHPNTWSDRPVCYLEDLYVRPEARRLGRGSALVRALEALGRGEGWHRIYWITARDNAAARAAYARLARDTGHVRYEIALGAAREAGG